MALSRPARTSFRSDSGPSDRTATTRSAARPGRRSMWSRRSQAGRARRIRPHLPRRRPVRLRGDGAERQKQIDRLKRRLADTGLIVPMITTNLFSHPVFKDGGFTSNDRAVRRFALRKVLRNIDLAAELGAKTFVMWGGREGAEYDAAKDVRAALERYREAVEPARRVRHRQGVRHPVRDRAEAERAARRHPAADRRARHRVHQRRSSGPNCRRQPRGRARADGRAQLHRRHRAGAVPRQAVPHRPERAARHQVRPGPRLRPRRPAQRVLAGRPAGKRRPGRRADLHGPRHFDYKPSRTEDITGVWDSAAANMRTYLLLKERAAAFRADPEVQEALAASRVPELSVPTLNDGESYDDLLADRSAYEDFDTDAYFGGSGFGFVRLQPGHRAPARRALAFADPGIRRRAASVTSLSSFRRVCDGWGCAGGGEQQPQLPLWSQHLLNSERNTDAIGCRRRLVDAELQGRHPGRSTAAPSCAPVARRIRMEPRSTRRRGGRRCSQRSRMPAASTTCRRSRSPASSTAWSCWMPRAVSSARAAVERHPLARAAGDLIAEVGAESFAQRTGTVPVASFTITKLRWLRDHEPDKAARVAAVALPHDWLTWRLRGYGPAGESALGPDLDELMTDRSDASGTSYWNPATGDYDLDLLVARPRPRRRCETARLLPTVLDPGAAPACDRIRTSAGAAGLIARCGHGRQRRRRPRARCGARRRRRLAGHERHRLRGHRPAGADASGTVAGFADAAGGSSRSSPPSMPPACLDPSPRSSVSTTTNSVALRSQLSPVPTAWCWCRTSRASARPNLPDATATLYRLTPCLHHPEQPCARGHRGHAVRTGRRPRRRARPGRRGRRILLIGGAAQNPAVRRSRPRCSTCPRGAGARRICRRSGRRPGGVGADRHAPDLAGAAGGRARPDYRPIIRQQYAAAIG